MEEKKIDLDTLSEMQLQSKKMKKKLILILGSVCLITAVLFGVIIAISSPEDSKNIPENPIHTYEDADFYQPYEGNILENQEYLGLDRKVYYSDGSGMETSIEDDNFNEFNQEVKFLYHYLQTIVAGDVEAYNACFNNSNYYMETFNPQMIYNSKITKSGQGNDEKGNYVTYKLEYMIHRNDGSFRRDILSDASLPQYITLRIGTEGDIFIEKILTHYEIVVSPES